MAKDNRRQKLQVLAESGNLRYNLESASPKIDDEVIDLIVDICLRYCEPERKRRA